MVFWSKASLLAALSFDMITSEPGESTESLCLNDTNSSHLFTVWTCSSARTWRVSSTFGRIENVGIVAVDVILLLLNLGNHPRHLSRRRLVPTNIRNLFPKIDAGKEVTKQVDNFN